MGAYDDADHPWLDGREGSWCARRSPTAPRCSASAWATSWSRWRSAARSGPNPRGQQIGVLDVGWTAEADDDRLLGRRRGARPTRPPCSGTTTSSPGCRTAPSTSPHTGRGELQAARFAPAVWGVQWHPEAGEEIIRPWADHDRDDAVERGVDVDAYVADVAAARDELRRDLAAAGRRGSPRVCRRAGAGPTRPRR